MEAVIFAGSSAVAYSLAVAADRLQLRGARRRMMLPHVMEQKDRSEAKLLLLVVHIRSVSLLSRFEGEEMKVRVKHGGPRVSAACDTAAVRFDRELAFRSRTQSWPVAADFDTSCVFLWQGDPTPELRIRLVGGSRKGRAVAKAIVPLGEDAVGLQEFSVQLIGLPGLFAPSAETVGRASIAAEVRCMSKGDLQRHLERLHAQRRQGAFVLAEVPVALGDVKDLCEESEQEVDMVVQGLPLATLPRAVGR
jgi:hypothetical protein